jgi:hypothetical protein
MMDKNKIHSYSPIATHSVKQKSDRNKLGNPFEKKPPRKPDWVMILVSIFILLTLLIGWYVDIPGLFW